jgi:hypothetical protein
MYYTIYKITNKIDGKIYVGSHKTKDLNDKYMGSGKYLKYAQEKYGIENFTKEILFIFDTPEEMYAKEAEIVTENFLAENNTYNLKRGGFGGFDYINKNSLYGFSNIETAKLGRKNADLVLEKKYGSNWRSEFLNRRSPEEKTKSISKSIETKKINGYVPAVSQLNSKEAIEKKKETFKSNGHQQAEKNSQFGKQWITDGQFSKSIPKTSDIPFGWKKGRIIKNNIL